MKTKLEAVQAVLKLAGDTHHAFFADDENWALWYAGFLLGPLTQILRMDADDISVQYLAWDLESYATVAEQAGETDWVKFYAEQIMADYSYGKDLWAFLEGGEEDVGAGDAVPAPAGSRRSD